MDLTVATLHTVEALEFIFCCPLYRFLMVFPPHFIRSFVTLAHNFYLLLGEMLFC